MSQSATKGLILVGAVFLAGCALTTGSRGQGGMRDIQIDEIRSTRASNVMDLIEKVRPGWLYFHELRDPSDPSETRGPMVMINDVPPRPLFTLQYLSLENVAEIRYLTRSYAMQRYRVNSPAGVILVISPPLVGPGAETQPDTGRVY